jgi:glycosyltransferase involved in cell wall biosynthesis
MIISILIPTIERRRPILDKLLRHLMSQIYSLGVNKSVEVLINSDNKEKPTGKKRNELLCNACGEYIVFIDDDDWVPVYYTEELLRASVSNADCFAINGIHTLNGQNPTEWRISKGYDNINRGDGVKTVYFRKTNHIAPVRRVLAIIHGFPEKYNAEDKWYSDHLNPYLKTEYVIEKPMYEYREKSGQKEYT